MPLTRAGNLKISKAWYDKFSKERGHLEKAGLTPLPLEVLENGFAHSCLGSTKPIFYLENVSEGGWWGPMNEWAKTVGLKPGWLLVPSVDNDDSPDDEHEGLLVHEDDLLRHVGGSMDFYRASFGIEGDMTPADMLHRHVLPFWESIRPAEFDKAPDIDRISMGLGYGASGKDYKERGWRDPDFAKENDRMGAYIESRMAALKAKGDRGFFAPLPPEFIKPERPDIRDILDRYIAESSEIQDAFIALERRPEARGMDREGLVVCAVLGQIFNDPPTSPSDAAPLAEGADPGKKEKGKDKDREGTTRAGS